MLPARLLIPQLPTFWTRLGMSQVDPKPPFTDGPRSSSSSSKSDTLRVALSVKMGAWSKLFPHQRASGLAKRAEFILSEMKLGIEKIREVEAEVPPVASFD